MNALRRKSSDDKGHTISELMIVCALLAVVAAAILQSMISTTRVTKSGSDRAFSVAEARTTIEQFERDIRAANPIEAAANIGEYETTIAFNVYCSNPGVGSCNTSNLRLITWHYDDVTKELSRSEGGTTTMVLGPQGASGLAVDKQQLAVVNPSGQPIFRYYDRTGSLMPTDATYGGSTNDFRNCAKEVVVTLVVRAESNTNSVIDFTTSATLRNHNEVIGC